MPLDENTVRLAKGKNLASVVTVMPSGQPQAQLTWVDTDGEHILINTVQGHQKVRNIERDPRVALTVSDPDQPARYYGVRGRVLGMTTEGAAAHIDELAQRYTGAPYAWYGGRDQVRVLLTIEAGRINGAR
jgi:PPOX class probable F420-dependent enzyme